MLKCLQDKSSLLAATCKFLYILLPPKKPKCKMTSTLVKFCFKIIQIANYMSAKLRRTRVSKQHFKFETIITPESRGRKWRKRGSDNVLLASKTLMLILFCSKMRTRRNATRERKRAFRMYPNLLHTGVALPYVKQTFLL